MTGSFEMDFETFAWGSDYYLQTGRMMPAMLYPSFLILMPFILGPLVYPGGYQTT